MLSAKWQLFYLGLNVLTHWGRVTPICLTKVANIGSGNGLSPGRRQAIIWTNVGILLSGPLATNFSEILIEIYIFSLKKMYMEMSSGNRRPFCLALNVLIWTCCSVSVPTSLWSTLHQSFPLCTTLPGKWLSQWLSMLEILPITLKTCHNVPVLEQN